MEFISSHINISAVEFKYIVLSVIFFVAGIVSFYLAYKNSVTAKLIKNTATTSISSLRSGFVEIKGKAKATASELLSPATKAVCVYYEYKIEQLQSTRNSRKHGGQKKSWKIIDQGTSGNIPFICKDDSGEVEVMPERAQFISKNKTKSLNSSSFSLNVPGEKTSPRANDFLSNLGGISKVAQALGVTGRPPIRITENLLLPGDQLYVLGYAKKRAKKVYEIVKYKKYPFIISNFSERALVKKLQWGVSWKILFGIALFALAYLVLRYRL